MRTRAARICLLAFCLASYPSVVPAEGLTREQGEAILGELRQIRTLLERQQRRPGSAPQAPAPQPPAPQERATLSLGGNDYSLGAADAAVTIVEYTDYECRFCGRFWSGTFPDIKRNFIDTGVARFIKRDLPLAAHPNALKTAQAARCAGDQGKFWEMHDRLSAESSVPAPDAYARLAGELSLDVPSFRTCLDSDRHIADIRASGQGAAASGITATPVFVIGTVKGNMLEGVKIVGAQPYSVFERAITDVLRCRAE